MNENIKVILDKIGGYNIRVYDKKKTNYNPKKFLM